MQIDRAVVVQVLDFCERVHDGEWLSGYSLGMNRDEVVTALREALAAPEREPDTHESDPHNPANY